MKRFIPEKQRKNKSSQKSVSICQISGKGGIYFSGINGCDVYLNIVKMDKYISLQSDFVALRKGIYERTKNKHKYGVASYVELNNAENAYLNSKLFLKIYAKNASFF
jgi:hypothetical protein